MSRDTRPRAWHWPSNRYRELPRQEPLLPLDEMVRRIEAMRRDAPPAPITRRCAMCGVEQPLTMFARSAPQTSGRDYYCKPCKRAWLREYRARKKRETFRAIWAIPWRSA